MQDEFGKKSNKIGSEIRWEIPSYMLPVHIVVEGFAKPFQVQRLNKTVQNVKMWF